MEREATWVVREAASGEQRAYFALRIVQQPFEGVTVDQAREARVPEAHQPRVFAQVRADVVEREGERLAREATAVRELVAAARVRLAAAERRARLAVENRGYYDKSFRFGETDLPTRLRIETEAFEAERALGRARIALAQGISQWRQALGLLPE